MRIAGWFAFVVVLVVAPNARAGAEVETGVTTTVELDPSVSVGLSQPLWAHEGWEVAISNGATFASTTDPTWSSALRLAGPGPFGAAWEVGFGTDATPVGIAIPTLTLAAHSPEVAQFRLLLEAATPLGADPVSLSAALEFGLTDATTLGLAATRSLSASPLEFRATAAYAF